MSDLIDTVTYTITLTSATHLVLLQQIIIIIIKSLYKYYNPPYKLLFISYKLLFISYKLNI
jgi:hypothetical protein